MVSCSCAVINPDDSRFASLALTLLIALQSRTSPVFVFILPDDAKNLPLCRKSVNSTAVGFESRVTNCLPFSQAKHSSDSSLLRYFHHSKKIYHAKPYCSFPSFGIQWTTTVRLLNNGISLNLCTLFGSLNKGCTALPCISQPCVYF